MLRSLGPLQWLMRPWDSSSVLLKFVSLWGQYNHQLNYDGLTSSTSYRLKNSESDPLPSVHLHLPTSSYLISWYRRILKTLTVFTNNQFLYLHNRLNLNLRISPGSFPDKVTSVLGSTNNSSMVGSMGGDTLQEGVNLFLYSTTEVPLFSHKTEWLVLAFHSKATTVISFYYTSIWYRLRNRE